MGAQPRGNNFRERGYDAVLKLSRTSDYKSSHRAKYLLVNSARNECFVLEGCEKILVNVTVRVLATSISGVSSTVLHRLKALTAL
jgi:hypothetical protein